MRYQLSNSTVMECSICLELINNDVNKIVTECGHHYHANCLLKHTHMNGYGCPLCRSDMVETESQNDDEEDDDDDYEDDYDDDQMEEIEQIEREEYVLRGFRYMYSQIGEEMYEEPDSEEYENRHNTVSSNMEEFQKKAQERTRKIMERVSNIEKLTYEELIMAALYNINDEPFQEEMSLEHSDKHVMSVLKVEGILKKVSKMIQEEEGSLPNPLLED